MVYEENFTGLIHPAFTADTIYQLHTSLPLLWPPVTFAPLTMLGFLFLGFKQNKSKHMIKWRNMSHI